jgi:PHD/YefM family antitoxin component YafN of YafNO toxin-antitoxin module
VTVPVVMSFREFRAGLAGVLDQVRQSPKAAVFVGSHRSAEAVLVSVEQYEALLEAAERQRAVAAALASVRAEGLEPGAADLTLFAEMAAGRLTTDELRERVLSLPEVSKPPGPDPYRDPASGILGDVYEWGGALRTVSISKGSLFCLPQHLDSYGGDIFGRWPRRIG